MYNKINAVQAKGIGLDLFKWGKSTHVWGIPIEVPEGHHTLAAMHIEGSISIQVQQKPAHTASTRNNDAPEDLHI